MKKESDKFWNFERTEKAKAMKLTPVEIITLASIVDEETADNGEKPMIAGMYYNRLKLRNAEYPEGMPLPGRSYHQICLAAIRPQAHLQQPPVYQEPV